MCDREGAQAPVIGATTKGEVGEGRGGYGGY